MFKFEANENNVVIKAKQVLEDALSTNPKTKKRVQEIIRKELFKVRRLVVDNIKFKHGDPRGARFAVRTSVYRQILGGNINIYNSKKAHGETSYIPPRKGSTRGGNRKTRSETTKRYMSYAGYDRGFILRWLNTGTADRGVRFNYIEDGRKVDKWNRHPNTGNRGRIEPRHFFSTLGERALNQAVENISRIVEEELTKITTE